MSDIVDLLIVFGAMIGTALLVVVCAWIFFKVSLSTQAKVAIAKARHTTIAVVQFLILWVTLYASFTFLKLFKPTSLGLAGLGVVLGLVFVVGPLLLSTARTRIGTLSRRVSRGWARFFAAHQLLVWVGIPVTIWIATIALLGWWLAIGDGGFQWWDRSAWLTGSESSQRLAAEVRTEEIRNLIGMLAVLLGSLAAAFTLGNTLHRTTVQDAEHQTNRDRLNAEVFAKAVEQLANDNNAIRLGAIYGMESLARAQAPHAAGALVVRQIMETIAAFIRNRTQQDEGEVSEDQNDLFDHEPPTGRTDVDISAALLVLLRSYPIDHRPSLEGQGGVNLRRVQLPNVELPANVDFRSFDLRDAHLAGIRATGANFLGARLSRADLRAAQLENARFNEASLVDSSFSQARLTGADFTRAAITDTDFSQATLMRAVFRGARMLGNTNFTSATMLEARLNGCLFGRCDFSNATLLDAHMQHSIFSRCAFTNADLAGADVTGATFVEGTDLTGVVFEREPDADAVQRGLRVKGLTPKQLLTARWDPNRPPKWPSNFAAPHDGTGAATA